MTPRRGAEVYGLLPSVLTADMRLGRRAWQVYWRPVGSETWEPVGYPVSHAVGVQELARLGRDRRQGTAILSHVSLPAPGSRPQPKEKPLVQGELFPSEAGPGRPA